MVDYLSDENILCFTLRGTRGSYAPSDLRNFLNSFTFIHFHALTVCSAAGASAFFLVSAASSSTLVDSSTFFSPSEAAAFSSEAASGFSEARSFLICSQTVQVAGQCRGEGLGLA